MVPPHVPPDQLTTRYNKWKHVFNPNHDAPRIDRTALQGSVDANLLELFPEQARIQICFEDDYVTLLPNFNLYIMGLDEWEAPMTNAQKDAFQRLPYGTRWRLFLTNTLIYDIVINQKKA